MGLIADLKAEPDRIKFLAEMLGRNPEWKQLMLEHNGDSKAALAAARTLKGRANDQRLVDRTVRAEVQVKNYKDAKAYQRDAAAMASMGWLPQGQTGQRGKVKVGSTAVKGAVFLPWAFMRPARKGDPITVTWVREPKPAAVSPPPPTY